MSTKTDNPMVRLAWQAVMQAHNTTSVAHCCFDDLGTLFRAIADASDESSQAAKLAKIGMFLAEDLATRHDSERESLESHIDALRAALGFSPIKREGGAA